MEKKPVLVIMAAGMGSRYGGLKQIDPVDREGDLIIDFSIYDAVEAGFEKVVFIIKKAIEKDFKEHIGRRMEKHVEVEYVYQEMIKRTSYIINEFFIRDTRCDNSYVYPSLSSQT